MKLNSITDDRVYKLLEEFTTTPVFVVGGTVRDYIMNNNTGNDIDIAYGTRTPDEVTNYFNLKGYHVVPTGLKFGVFRIVLQDKNTNVTTNVDVAHFRAETYKYGDRHPEQVKYLDTIEEDLARRDFTINAIALQYVGDEEFLIVDPYGGINDIKSKIIRAVGDPYERLKEDPLRALRGLRFASRFGFTIEPKTMEAIQELSLER